MNLRRNFDGSLESLRFPPVPLKDRNEAACDSSASRQLLCGRAAVTHVAMSLPLP